MKISFVAMFVLAVTSAVIADESRRAPLLDDVPGLSSLRAQTKPASTPSTSVERRVSLPAEKDSAANEGWSTDHWRPKLTIRLNLTPDGQSQVTERAQSVSVPVYRRDEAGVAQLSYVTEQRVVRTVNPGQAVMACDDINIAVSPDENGELSYDVSCAGRTRLIVSCMTVDCESIVMKNGMAVCSNAKIANNGVVATAESLSLQLNVHGVVTSKFGQPLASLSAPISPTIQPIPGEDSRYHGDDFDDRAFDRDAGDWAPSDDSRPADFGRSDFDDNRFVPQPDNSGLDDDSFGGDFRERRPPVNDSDDVPATRLGTEADEGFPFQRDSVVPSLEDEAGGATDATDSSADKPEVIESFKDFEPPSDSPTEADAELN